MSIDRQEIIRRITVQAKRQLYRTLQQQEPSAWLCPSLTVAQLRAIMLLNDQGCMAPGDLALAVGVSKSSATEMIKRLTAQGLVTHRRHTSDPRNYLVYLTEKGQTQAAKLQEISIAGIDGALTRMDQEDLLALERGMEALARAMTTQASRSF